MLGPLAAAAAQTDFERAKARYDECIQRLPFDHHTQGRVALARTHSAEALEILAADYAKPPSYPEYARYTLAALFGGQFTAPEFVARFDAMRAKHAHAEDAWLWVNTLATRVRHQGPQAAIDVVEKNKDVLLRAAALLALARAKSDAALELIPEQCLHLPVKEGEKRAVIAAMSSAIVALAKQRATPAYQDAARAYIQLLAPTVKLSDSLEIMIARHLGKALGSDAMWVNPEPWLELLERPAAAKRPGDSVTVARPRFFGIEADGDRICYVIDLSDSMCEKIDPSIKPQAAVTGPRPKRKRGVPPDETDIPWPIVETRFDLAREHLKISLQRLDDAKRFSIVWFGTEAGTLESCQGMIKATPGNVARVIKELDEIKPGPPKPPDAPHGTLRGRTNLHGALREAFSLRSKGYVEAHDFVDPTAIAEGCDTIFVLSDGAPSWDDFSILDKDYGEGRVVRDTEYGREVPRTERLHYWGPYGQTPWILEDLERLNAFRKTQIHCVGIGEANMGLLRAIAGAAMGQTYEMGASKKAGG